MNKFKTLILALMLSLPVIAQETTTEIISPDNLMRFKVVWKEGMVVQVYVYQLVLSEEWDGTTTTNKYHWERVNEFLTMPDNWSENKYLEIKGNPVKANAN